jgi:hypothetical protein
MSRCPSFRVGVRLVFTLLFLSGGATARADWFIVPGLGLSFAGNTNLISLDNPENPAGGTHVTYEGSVLWLGEGWLGLDAEAGFAFGFFEGGAGLVRHSSVATFMGSVVVTVPHSVTRHSLRPYAVAGFGLIRASSEDLFAANPVSENLLGLRIGGGATGFLTDSVGVRWDLSHIRTLKGQGNEAGVAVGGSRSLSFWRASMGIVLRF